FLLKFYNSKPILLLRNILTEIIGAKAKWLYFDSECNLVSGKAKVDTDISKILTRLRSKPSKEIQIFTCLSGKMCLSIPVTQGDNLYGYILVFYLKCEPDKNHLSFTQILIDTSLKEFQKEQELTKLYDTIRPRAIALSTIHTVHRLLTSTLDMDELIERIARLTLQVMRAKYCSIMLLDDSKDYLLPKAVIDLKNNTRGKKRHRKIKVGSYTEGKVAKTGKTILQQNLVCIPLIEEDIIGVLVARDKTNKTSFNKFDLEILLTLAEQAVIAIGNARLYEEQDKMAYGSIKSLAALLDAKSPNTFTHSEQFVKVVLAIAEEMRLPREEIRNLRYAALLPDTGKFSIPDEILKKQGGLSREEYNIIKKQHLESLKILGPLEFLKPAVPIIMYHHERYDGTGYPEGLKGQDIPIGARIMAVADAFEAMVSSSPYKDTKKSISQAIKEIEHNSGVQFDPGVVNAFISVSKKPEFQKLY
ncbi:MAG: HD domain-containing protein, partial [Candidatus Omnitrophica bacterium]|nr:HD domain-containing protein [Candidatus Omnitrophota bacterium]